jgi:type II secretory pathway component GspD/PulD (secretin)
MGLRNGKGQMKRFYIGALVIILIGNTFAVADTLKLRDVPLSEIIEIYSRETKKNVFVDEALQQQRRVTAHIQNMPMAEAFPMLQKTLGIESQDIGTDSVAIYPPDHAPRYRSEVNSAVIRLPLGVDSKWAVTAFTSLLPGAQVSLYGNDNHSVLVVGTSIVIETARGLAKSFPAGSQVRRVLVMPEGEAKLAARELVLEEGKLEPVPNGLNLHGPTKLIQDFLPLLQSWRQQTQWGSEVFTIENMDIGKAQKAAEAARRRASISDLGGTGALLIEGPAIDRQRVLSILQSLDQKSELVRKEVLLGDITPQAAKDALRTTNISVQGAGDRRLVLVGRSKDVTRAAEVITILGKKRHQVSISFRLAEIARSRMRKLGIDLDKNVYSYGEIKQFQGQDVLPLLLRLLHEDNDSHILAQPNLRVLEREEARVLIGDRIPLEVAASAQTESGSIIKLNTQLSWVDVGIKLTAKSVQVTSTGEICMGLKSEVSTVVSLTKNGYPQIRTREAESSLRVKNGGTIIMGGLISREERNGASKIPLLGNIPLFGGLARSRNRQKDDTEIIMLVTATTITE